MGRELVIGDIHGGLKALIQVLDKANIKEDDKLIFLGDYVDGWADSFQLVDYLITLNKFFDCVFIIGNHDIWCRDWLTTGMVTIVGSNQNWSNARGGISTIRSYEDAMQPTEEHIKFFRTLHHFYEDLHNNRVYLHAGYTQEAGVRFENPTTNLWWDRSLIEKAINHENKFGKKDKLYKEYYPKFLKTYNEIFIGHTSTQIYGTTEPIFACNVINVDTGCGHRQGRLTIMDVDTKEFWQSDKLMNLYPDDEHNNFMRNHGG